MEKAVPPMTGREGEVTLLENGKVGSCEQMQSLAEIRWKGGQV